MMFRSYRWRRWPGLRNRRYKPHSACLLQAIGRQLWEFDSGLVLFCPSCFLPLFRKRSFLRGGFLGYPIAPRAICPRMFPSAVGNLHHILLRDQTMTIIQKPLGSRFGPEEIEAVCRAMRSGRVSGLTKEGEVDAFARELAERRGSCFVFDAARCAGGKFKARDVGVIPHMTVFSFQVTLR